MQVHRDIGCSSVEMRWLDLRDDAPRRHPGDILRDVVPFLTAFLCVPDLAVVGAGPDEALLNIGRSDGENHLAIELAEIVADDSPRGDDTAGILRRQVRADHAPTGAAVGGPEDNLAAVVHGLVIER